MEEQLPKAPAAGRHPWKVNSSVRVINPNVCEISFDKPARDLNPIAGMSHNKFMVRFTADGHATVVFPDGRAITRNTDDESIARGLHSNTSVRALSLRRSGFEESDLYEERPLLMFERG
jgi:hypothetical protein